MIKWRKPIDFAVLILYLCIVRQKKFHKAYKFRIYPNKKQEVMINKTFGCVRFYWNNLIETFNSYDKETNPNPQFHTPKELREQFPWLKEVSYVALQQKQRDFLLLRKKVLSSGRKTQSPNFHKKTGEQFYRLTNQRVTIVAGGLKLEKLGIVPTVFDRKLSPDAELVNVTISKNCADQYFASIGVQAFIKEKPKTKKDIGIDLGIKEFAVLSNGVVIKNPHFFRESQSKLVRAQRHLSRKQKGSVRRNKCKHRVAVIHNNIANQRKDFIHKTTTSLINKFDTIYLEDLNVSGLLKNHKLAKAIVDVGWGKFRETLSYKAKWYGKKVVFIDRFAPSSKTCSKCGWKNDKLTLKDRTFECPECGLVLDRDLNAAKNIQAFGATSAIRTQSGESTNRDEAFTTLLNG